MFELLATYKNAKLSIKNWVIKYINDVNRANKLNEIRLLLKLIILLNIDERSTKKTEKHARESSIFPNKSFICCQT